MVPYSRPAHLDRYRWVSRIRIGFVLGKSSLDEIVVTPIADDLYRIGTVAKLTGIAVERLRAWERRYGLVPAHRSGKTRFYDASQLARLKKIKQLIDAGHPISTLVNLDDAQLDERLQVRETVAMQPATVGLIGANLLVLEQAHGADTRLDIQSRWANIAAYQADQSGTARLDVIVAQLPVLGLQHVESITEIHPSARVVVVYQFATEASLEAVSAAGHPALQWPVAWGELEHVCATTAGAPLRAARTAPRRFTDEELIAIATSADDPAGCPAHLVEIINQLNAFADYSIECADSFPDRKFYERIHTDTTHARAQMELALQAWAEADATLPTPN